MIIKIFSLFLSYLIGSFSGSFFLGKIFKGIDIRHHGSGNAGTTNAMRILGKKIGSLTFLIDLLKGYLTMFLFTRFFENTIFLIAFFCVLGHDFPFYMDYKGGKGIATSLGCFMFYNPLFSLFGVCAGVITSLISKFVSLGSMIFLTSTSLLFVFFDELSVINILSIFFICVLGILRHRSNIQRILTGTESKIGGIK